MATVGEITDLSPVDLAGDFESSLDTFSMLNQEIESLKAECTEFSFLAVGKTGAGKSTLLNALADTDKFHSSSDRSQAGTKHVSKYEFERNGVTITAWDSPGFEDSSGTEEEYKQEIRENCKDVDVVMYCISLKETRSDLGEDASSLKQITDALTVNVWKKSAIVLTFANKLQRRLELENKRTVEEAFAQKVQMWKEKVQDTLREAGVDDAILQTIPVIPAGHTKKKHLPGHKYWLSRLWFSVLRAVNDERAKLALQRANEGRFVDEKNGETSSPTALVVTRDHVAIAAGSAIGVVGVVAGGTTGALIGALAIGIPTFGVAAGVGLVLGLVVGGAVGGGVGTGVGALIKKIREKRRKKRDSESAENDSQALIDTDSCSQLD